MRRGQSLFWLAAGLLVILLPVGAYFVMVEVGAAPQDDAPDPKLVATVGGIVSGVWTLYSVLRWLVGRIAEKSPPAGVEVVDREVARAIERCSVGERAFFDQHRVPTHETSLAQGRRGRPVHVVALRESEVILWDRRLDGFALSRVAEGFQVLEPGGEPLELSTAIQQWMQELPPAGPVDRGSEIPPRRG